MNVDTSLIIYASNLKSCKHIENITAERTVSQIFYIGPGSFFFFMNIRIFFFFFLTVLCHKIITKT